MQLFKKKIFGEQKKRKIKIGNKTFQSAELRKCSVLRKKSFWKGKKQKMKTLEIRHSRAQNSGNAAFCEKKDMGREKWKKENFGNKTLQKAEHQKWKDLGKKNTG